TGSAMGGMGTETATSPQDFVQKVAMSNLYEVQAAKAVLTKPGIDAKVKDFAQKMVTAHTDATKELKTTATAENLTVPTSLDADHQTMIDQIKAATGTGAGKVYIDQQVDAHQQALSLLQSYASSGDDAKLKQVAQNMTPTVQEHLNDAKSLQSSTSTS